MADHSAQGLNTTEKKEPLRLLALSDGLFATVLTLLVLDLRIPETLNVDGDGTAAFVRWVGPHLFSYLLTFLVTGTYWRAHHRDFDRIIDTDRGLLSYNLLFLLFIGLLPFSTATISLGTFRSTAYPFYWAIYAANIILAGLMLTLTWNYAVSHGLAAGDLTPQQRKQFTLRELVTPVVFLCSIVGEFLSPQVFLGPYMLVVIPLLSRWVDRRFAPAEPHQSRGGARRLELLWRLGATLVWLLIMGLAVWAMSV